MHGCYSMIDPPDGPDVRTIDASAVFYHGTHAAQFDRPYPGTCFTSNWDIAKFHSRRGAFQDAAKVDGAPRMLTADVNLPEEASFIPASQLCKELISMARTIKVASQEDEIMRDQEHQKVRAFYHDQAAEHTGRLATVPISPICTPVWNTPPSSSSTPPRSPSPTTTSIQPSLPDHD